MFYTITNISLNFFHLLKFYENSKFSALIKMSNDKSTTRDFVEIAQESSIIGINKKYKYIAEGIFDTCLFFIAEYI